MNLRFPWQATVVTVCALLLTACMSTAPVSLYVLQPASQERLGPDFVDFAEMILIMPVQLTPQVQNQGLLVRRADGELHTSPGHLWAGPLDEQIGASLAAALRGLLGTDQVAVFPGPRFATTRYQVEVEVTNFSDNSGSFTVRAVYTVSDTVSRKMLARHAFDRTLAVDAAGHAGSVAAASRAVDALSQEIATSLLGAERSRRATSLSPAP